MIKKYHTHAIAFILICSSVGLPAQKSVYTFPFENEYRLPVGRGKKAVSIYTMPTRRALCTEH